MSRREDLLSLLFDHGENPLPAAVAAQHLGVSTRTVRAYVNFINREYGDIVESSRAGYRLKTRGNLPRVRCARGRGLGSEARVNGLPTFCGY